MFKDINFDKKEINKTNANNFVLELVKEDCNTVHKLINIKNMNLIISAIAKLAPAKLNQQAIDQIEMDFLDVVQKYSSDLIQGKQYFIKFLEKYLNSNSKIEYILRNHAEVYSRGNTVLIHNKQSYCNEFNEDLIKNIILYNEPRYKHNIVQNEIHNFFEKYVMLDICYDYYNGYHKRNNHFPNKLLYILQSNTISKIYNDNLPTNVLIAHIDKAENINNKCGNDLGNRRKTSFLWYNTFEEHRVNDVSNVIFNYRDCVDVVCSECECSNYIINSVYVYL